jgi:outer membrane protein TolC
MHVTLPEVGRGRLRVDSGPPESPTFETLPAPSAASFSAIPARRYVRITPPECKCLVASNSTLANLVDSERAMALCRPGSLWLARIDAADLLNHVLALRAADERNCSAAAALELYYRAAETEMSLDWLEQGIVELQDALDNAARLQASGIETTIDTAALRQQQIELRVKANEAVRTRDEINGKLRLLLALDAADRPYIWPEADLSVVPIVASESALVSEGFASRADLAVLRLACQRLDVASLPAVQALLGQQDPLLGGGATGTGVIGRMFTGGADVAARGAQLSQLMRARERQVVEEILTASQTLESRRWEVELRRESRDVATERLAELEKKRPLGTATAFDVSAQRMKLIEAESQLASAVTTWHVARVKLEESTGTLARACGHGASCPICGR